MADFEKLQQTMETNFRLSILHSREIGARLSERLDGLSKTTTKLSQQTTKLSQQTTELSQQTTKLSQQTTELSQQTTELSQQTTKLSQQTTKLSQQTKGLAEEMVHLNTGVTELGREVHQGFNSMADDQQKVLDVLMSIGDGTVDLRKELAELKARVERLERKAS